MTVRRAFAVVMLVTAGLLAGCGGGDDDPAATPPATTAATSEPAYLTADDTVRVAEINLALAQYCVAVIGGDAPGAGLQDEVLEGVDELIALTRQDPEALVQFGDDPPLTMRQYLGDAASTLDNGSCAPSLAAEIDRALATL